MIHFQYTPVVHGSGGGRGRGKGGEGGKGRRETGRKGERRGRTKSTWFHPRLCVAFITEQACIVPATFPLPHSLVTEGAMVTPVWLDCLTAIAVAYASIPTDRLHRKLSCYLTKKRPHVYLRESVEQDQK